MIPSLPSRTRVVVLQHPGEARHALNTARLAVLGLRNARLLVGDRFTSDAWRTPGYVPHLLFPGAAARILVRGDGNMISGGESRDGGDGNGIVEGHGGSNGDAQGNCGAHDGGATKGHGHGSEEACCECAAPSPRPAAPCLLVVPDGTWRHARNLLRLNPELAELPRVALPAGSVSRYRVRQARESGALSTLEAIVQALNALEAQAAFDALLRPFDALVDGQIAAMGADVYERHHVRRAGARSR